MDMKKLERLMELMARHGVNELELDDKTSKVRIKTGASAPAHGPALAAPVQMQSLTEAKDAPPAAKSIAKGQYKEVRSPFVGTYYESPSPGAENFIRIGQRVNKGDVLCIIEAMKLMNEIEADASGVIKEILVENEQLWNSTRFSFWLSKVT